MNAQNTIKRGHAGVALALALGFLALLGSTGCDEYGAIASWGGLANPWSTSSLGLPEYPPSFWEALGMGTQNVSSWRGLANPWYTSSLGLPVAPF